MASLLNNNQLGDKIEAIGWTSYHTYVFVSSGCAWASDMLWIINISIFMSNAGDEYNLSATEEGLLSMSFMFGMFIGSYTWGFLGDIKGRIWVFRRTVTCAIIAAAALCAGVNYQMMLAFLFLCGVGIGGEQTIGGTILKEYLPESMSWVFTLLGATWQIGGTISGLLAMAVVAINYQGIELWRQCCIISLLFEISFFFIRLKIKETPRFLYSQGRIQECDDTLEFVIYNQLKQKSGKTDINVKMVEIDLSPTEQESKPDKKSALKEIFNHKYRFTSIMIFLMFFGYNFACLSFTFFMPVFLKNVGIEDGTVALYGTLSLQQFSGLIGILIFSRLVDGRLGRKGAVIICCALSAGFSFTILYSTTLATVIIFSSILVMVSQAGWSGLFTINAEIYETEVRSTGVGWGNAAAKLGGLVSPALTGVIVDSVGGEVVVMILVMAWFAIVGISVVFVKETRVVKVVSQKMSGMFNSTFFTSSEEYGNVFDRLVQDCNRRNLAKDAIARGRSQALIGNLEGVNAFLERQQKDIMRRSNSMRMRQLLKKEKEEEVIVQHEKKVGNHKAWLNRIYQGEYIKNAQLQQIREIKKFQEEQQADQLANKNHPRRKLDPEVQRRLLTPKRQTKVEQPPKRTMTPKQARLSGNRLMTSYQTKPQPQKKRYKLRSSHKNTQNEPIFSQLTFSTNSPI